MSAIVHRAWEVGSRAQKWCLSLRYSLWIIIKARGHGRTEREYRLVREEERGQNSGVDGGMEMG